MSTSDTQPPTPSPDPQPEDPAGVVDEALQPATAAKVAAAVSPAVARPPALSDDELVVLEGELDTATEGLLDTIATWLSAWWEQPILQVLTRNPTRAIAVAGSFPELKQKLRDLQGNSRTLVDEAVKPVLAPSEVNPNGQFTEILNTPISLLLGLVGRPLVEAGFAPASIGFDPAGDEFRVRTLPEHGDVAAAAVAYRHAAERVSDKRQQLERDEQARLRAEVETLWNQA
jgi:hypothetical protein